MANQVATKTIPALHKQDPKTVINDAIKDHLPKVEPTGHDVLVCVYERPTGIKMIDPLGREVEFDMSATSRNREDKFQGIVGLLVKIGPLAAEHGLYFNGGELPPIGSWVACPANAGVSFTLGDRMMRQLQANFIRLVLTDPDVVI